MGTLARQRAGRCDRELHHRHLPPNAISAPIHDRMPAILTKDDYAAWLGEADATPAQLRVMLKPYPAEAMEAVPISTKVNNVKNEGPELVEPIAHPAAS